MIKTNASGVLVGNYCAEGIETLEEAEGIYKRVRQGDPEAKVVKVTDIYSKEEKV